jgi:hypothetical protein
MQPELALDDPNLEQRRNPRVDLFQEIDCERDDVAVSSRVADLSVGGMFVDLQRTPFPAGSRITARFALRAGEPRLALEAEVHYVQDRIGMGLRFVSLKGRAPVSTSRCRSACGARGPAARRSTSARASSP